MCVLKSAIPDNPSVLTVLVHGNATRLGYNDTIIPQTYNWTELSIGELASAIRKHHKFVPGVTVQVYACNWAQGSGPKDLATALGAPVCAANKMVFPNLGVPSGTMVCGGRNTADLGKPPKWEPILSDRGGWFLFAP